MSDSYETQVKKNSGDPSFVNDRLNIQLLSILQASPLSHSKNNSIHNFLRQIKVLEGFTDYELRIFSQFLHRRNFSSNEIIFKEGDTGFGFYIIFLALSVFSPKRIQKSLKVQI